ncbi:hypothetical protein SAMN04489726_1258 [Allokutzneria albata]|uniref:Uncharacterized protein n=1 Tax=Allokutzneria albata TaxID=211114 RepID=A0A1G9SM55_ALLAB|nr:hypothetical protein SAMN04489726_1258 [Allokutzneria albata]
MCVPRFWFTLEGPQGEGVRAVGEPPHALPVGERQPLCCAEPPFFSTPEAQL